jgi:hypothetical protein
MIGLQIYHISLVTINDQGNLKIASDLSQVEYLFSQSLSLLGQHDSTPQFLQIKEFK